MSADGLALEADLEVVVQEAPDLDPAAAVGALCCGRGELQAQPLALHGVVVSDGCREAAGEQIRQVLRGCGKGTLLLCGVDA
ncbi:MAG: hypothetical protein ACYCO4_04750, partial [Sulfobacillus sp.]